MQRSANVQISALMIECMQLVRVEVDAAVGIANKCIIRPTVPKPGHHIVKLPRARITLIMGKCLLQAKVQRRIWVSRSDNIPTCTTVTQMIKRGKTPGDMKRFVVGG